MDYHSHSVIDRNIQFYLGITEGLNYDNMYYTNKHNMSTYLNKYRFNTDYLLGENEL